jgi:hypothetical protein
MTTTTNRSIASSLPRGRALLRDPRYNRGTAFTVRERSALGLEGLLPAAVLSLEQHAQRAYDQYRAQPDDLARNTFLAAVRQRNEVLFYKLLEDHLQSASTPGLNKKTVGPLPWRSPVVVGLPDEATVDDQLTGGAEDAERAPGHAELAVVRVCDRFHFELAVNVAQGRVEL